MLAAGPSSRGHEVLGGHLEPGDLRTFREDGPIVVAPKTDAAAAESAVHTGE